MSSAWVVETVDVFEHCDLDVPACLPDISPDQFGLERLEDEPVNGMGSREQATLDNRIIITVSLAVNERSKLTLVQRLILTRLSDGKAPRWAALI